MFVVQRILALTVILSLSSTACAPTLTAPQPVPATSTVRAADTSAPLTSTPSETSTPTATSNPTETSTSTKTPSPTGTFTETVTFTPSAIPTTASLNAQVTAGLLSCRYGPGPEYLYLYALRETANIKLIGRTDGANWHWVYVDGWNKCWLNANFLNIDEDWLSLPIVYPGIAKIPRSPYYDPTDWVGASRQGNIVEVSWNPIRLRAGDEEDEFMLLYILEVWRCEGGQLLFEPFATSDTSVSFVDEPGCSQPSHGRHYFQEKHGYAGPVEVPWPPHQTQP